MFSITYNYVDDSFDSKLDPTNHTKGEKFRLVDTFTKHLQFKHYPHHVFGCRVTSSNIVRYLPEQFYLRGAKLKIFMLMLVAKQVIDLQQSKTTLTVRD